jgi:hypothetical protein
MWLLPLHFQHCRGGMILALALCLAVPAVAQEASQVPSTEGGAQQTAPNAGSGDTPAAAPPSSSKPVKPYGGGSPLDVLMHAKLWETVPPAKDFVKESRPPESELQYQSTQIPPPKAEVGPAPPPPLKLRDSSQLKSLEGELEQAGAQNEKAASGKVKTFAAAAAREAAARLAAKVKIAKDKIKAKVAHMRADLPTDLHAR